MLIDKYLQKALGLILISIFSENFSIHMRCHNLYLLMKILMSSHFIDQESRNEFIK